MERKVIASYCLCNTVSINVYEVDHSIETMVLTGYNDDEPEWVEAHMRYEDDDDTEGTYGFTFNGMFVPFNECMRV